MKNKFKDLLLGSFGTLGYVIWLILSFAVMFAPLWFLDFSFWIYFVITMVLFIPFIGGIANFILWVWSFGVVLSQPLDGWSIFYFSAFALYCISTVLPFVINLIVVLFTNNSQQD